MPSLGPFLLRQPLDRGGMGVVWRAVHETRDVPVAIKVIPLQADGAAERLLRTEVRATAALDHAGIVTLFDHGVVEREEEGLPRGALWLAMELLTGGSLVPWLDDLSWDATRQLLLALLDALAHAHARGVIHRDIKPGNVLIAGPEDSRPGLRLTDFGIAAVLDGQGRGAIGQMAGTLHYMAPEQILGHWREYGPWTDFYALGVLAWRITTGRTPFHGRRGAPLLQAQLTETLPPYRPRTPVPAGTEAWLRRLLERDISARFERASDAALSLARLPNEGDTRSSAEILVGWGRAAAAGWLERAADATRGPRWVPPTWERPVDLAPRAALDGAGLGLWGLRQPPLLGRREEQDALWAEVRAAAARGAQRTAILVGAAGVGKSRLLTWVAERAEEIGVASAVRVQGRPEDPPGAALRRLAEQVLGTRGLGRWEVRDRIWEWLRLHGGEDADAATTLTGIVSEGHAAGPVRYASILDLVRRRAGERLAIIGLDDLDADPDLLGLAVWIGEQTPPWPVLVLGSASLEIRSGRESEREALAALQARPNVREIRVGALPPGEHHHLVRALLGFEGALAADLTERTHGNPGFAIELAGRWIASGALVSGVNGLALEAEADASLPTDLRTAWVDRAHRALRGLGPAAAEALEAAAILGVEPEEWVWGQLVPEAGLRRAVVARLADAGLIANDREDWSFLHAALPEAIAGELPPVRAALLHRAAARALSDRADEPTYAERIGRHKLAAGDPDGAVTPLLVAARGRMRAVGPRPALVLLRSAERGLEAAQAPADDARRGDLGVAASHLHLLLGDLPRALEVSGRIRDEAKRRGWPCQHLASLGFARALQASGALRRAAAVAAEVADDPTTPPAAHATARWLQGVLAARLDPSAAAAHLMASEAAYARLGEEGGRADCLQRRALLPGQDNPEALVAEALAIGERLGRNVQIARCLEARAELALRAQDYAPAEAAARRAARMWAATWPEAAAGAHLLLGRVLLARGRVAEAGAAAEAASGAQATPENAVLAAALRLVAAADCGDWASWDRHFRVVAGWFDDADLPSEPVLAGLLQAAGDAALQRGFKDRARPPWVLARECRIGDAERQRLDERLAGLRDGAQPPGYDGRPL